jgi:hypothetical protein
MPVPVRPYLRPALALPVLAALAGLVVSRLSWPPDTNPEPKAALVRMDDWELTDLLGRLESRGLGFRAFPTWEGGSVLYNAFLVRGGWTRDELQWLIKDQGCLEQWKGVVYCEREPRPEAAEARVTCWGDACLVAYPFIFFGDQELLMQIRSALSVE